MDGVLCDMDKALKDLGWNGKDWWTPIEGKEDFWINMPWMKDGKKLWKYLKQYTTHILSSPSRDPMSRSGKKKWCKRELGDVHVYLSNDKGTYADDRSILIDDREENITDWKKNGGIGILHKSASQTIKEIERIWSIG